MTARLGLVLAVLVATSQPSAAQVRGHMVVMFDALPDVADAAGAQAVGELRVRLFAETTRDPAPFLRVHLSGYVDGLVADRQPVGGMGTSHDALARPGDLYAEIRRDRFDVRAGFSRLVWGRLDEFQPTDVVNPIDLTRFLLEGRSEARLPVALVRGRLFMPGGTTLEAVVIPVFRASRFDQLDEPTSPFNLSPVPAGSRRETPRAGWRTLQGGVRLTSTIGRVDWGATAYRGYRTFPMLTLTDAGLVERFPRFTMVGGDFETVRGEWGVRGEAAAFLDDELQSTRAVRGVPGRSYEAGVGADRRAGSYRVALNVLVTRRTVDTGDPRGVPFEDDPELEGTDVALVASADRSFARETRTVRVFGVYDPTDDTTFARAIAAISLRDDVWLEGSGGIFAGSALDLIGRLTRRDFLYVRLKIYF
jgi:hypothetical protein